MLKKKCSIFNHPLLLKTMQNGGLTPRSDSFEWYNAYKLAVEENEKLKRSRIEAWEESCELEGKMEKMEMECKKKMDEVRKEWEIKNGELMGELLQTRMKVKTAEWANKQLKTQNISLMNRLISEKEVADASLEEGEENIAAKETLEKELVEAKRKTEDLKNDLLIAKEEVDCLFTLMIDCNCENNEHLKVKICDN